MSIRNALTRNPSKENSQKQVASIGNALTCNPSEGIYQQNELRLYAMHSRVIPLKGIIKTKLRLYVMRLRTISLQKTKQKNCSCSSTKQLLQLNQTH